MVDIQVAQEDGAQVVVDTQVAQEDGTQVVVDIQVDVSALLHKYKMKKKNIFPKRYSNRILTLFIQFHCSWLWKWLGLTLSPASPSRTLYKLQSEIL